MDWIHVLEVLGFLTFILWSSQCNHGNLGVLSEREFWLVFLT